MVERSLTAFQQKFMDRISSSYDRGELDDFILNIQLAEIDTKNSSYLITSPIIARFHNIIARGGVPTYNEKFALVRELEGIFLEGKGGFNTTSFSQLWKAFGEPLSPGQILL